MPGLQPLIARRSQGLFLFFPPGCTPPALEANLKASRSVRAHVSIAWAEESGLLPPLSTGSHASRTAPMKRYKHPSAQHASTPHPLMTQTWNPTQTRQTGAHPAPGLKPKSKNHGCTSTRSKYKTSRGLGENRDTPSKKGRNTTKSNGLNMCYVFLRDVYTSIIVYVCIICVMISFT